MDYENKNVISMLVVVALVLILVSCSNARINEEININTEIPDPNISSDTSLTLTQASYPVDIYIPTYAYNTNYKAWSQYFLKEFNIDITVNTKEKTDLEGTDYYIYFDIDDLACVYAPMYWVWNDWEQGNSNREGVYLLNLWGYSYFHYMTLVYNQKEHEEGWEETGTELWRPWNNYSISNYFPPDILTAYTDDSGKIWALPYEYKYPEVRIRKYNQDILNSIRKDVPEDIFELYDLLLAVKSDGNISQVLPSMKRDAVFSGFEDIVNAFGIKTSADSDMESFYSIQYDVEINNYRDIAFDENMKQCIEYFVMLIDQGLINLDNQVKDYNNEFYNNNIFSVYDTIDRKEDLTIPYSPKLYAYDYEPTLYYQPSRYVYVLGGGQEYDIQIEDMLNAFYTSSETKLSARYGKQREDFILNSNSQVVISEEEYSTAPRLIGEFPDDKYKLFSDSKINEFREEITNDNINSGYYKILGPQNGKMEAHFNRAKADEYWEEYLTKHDITCFAYTFYRMLGDYFFNQERPSVDEFLLSYRNEMKRQIETARVDSIRWWFTSSYNLGMKFEY